MSEGFFAPLPFSWDVFFCLFFQVATKEVVLQQMLESLPQSLVTWLGGGFKHFLFSPLPAEDEPILTNVFQMGWNHKPVDAFFPSTNN